MNKPEHEKIPAFYRKYVELVPEDKELMPLLIESRDGFLDLLKEIPEEKGSYAYAEKKWTIKELINHVCDAERIFAYRALRFGRGDLTDLPGFEQDDYVENSGANSLDFEELMTEFRNIRNSTIDLFNGFDSKALTRFGSANGFRIDVNTLGYIIIGHLYHHQRELKNKYLS